MGTVEHNARVGSSPTILPKLQDMAEMANATVNAKCI